MEDQYFDEIVFEDDRYWAVDRSAGEKAPLEIQSNVWGQKSDNKFVVEVRQATGGSWFSRERGSNPNLKQNLL